jgi:predicted DsbA family dithiol-disulfide isomerase
MRVEIWSDVVCPWCYVGKRNFEAALEQFEHRDQVEVIWRAFELDPSAPVEREGDYATHLARKYGMSLAQAQNMIQTMTATGAKAGAVLDFDRARPGNTFDAHRLLHLARERGSTP